MQQVYRWIARHSFPLLVVSSYALLWAAQLIPPQVDYFAWQRNLRVFSWIAALPTGLIVILLVFYTRDIKLYWVTVLLVVVVFSIACAFFGFRLASYFGVTINRAASCEYFLSDTTGIQVTWYTDKTAPKYTIGDQGEKPYDFSDQKAYVFFESSDDGGKTWAKRAYFEDQAPQQSICQTSSSLDKNFAWMWINRIIAITPDGGKSWIFHDVAESDTSRNRTSLSSDGYVIFEALFDDAQHGRVTFAVHHNTFDWGYTADVFTIVTTDGGRNWQTADNADTPD